MNSNPYIAQLQETPSTLIKRAGDDPAFKIAYNVVSDLLDDIAHSVKTAVADGSPSRPILPEPQKTTLPTTQAPAGGSRFDGLFDAFNSGVEHLNNIGESFELPKIEEKVLGVANNLLPKFHRWRFNASMSPASNTISKLTDTVSNLNPTLSGLVESAGDKIESLQSKIPEIINNGGTFNIGGKELKFTPEMIEEYAPNLKGLNWNPDQPSEAVRGVLQEDSKKWFSNRLQQEPWYRRVGYWITQLLNKIGLGGLLPESWNVAKNFDSQYANPEFHKQRYTEQLSNLYRTDPDAAYSLYNSMAAADPSVARKALTDHGIAAPDYSGTTGLLSKTFGN